MRLEMDKKRVLELDRLKEKLSKVSFFLRQTDKKIERMADIHLRQKRKINESKTFSLDLSLSVLLYPCELV